MWCIRCFKLFRLKYLFVDKYMYLYEEKDVNVFKVDIYVQYLICYKLRCLLLFLYNLFVFEICMKNKKIIKFYGSFFYKFLYIYMRG